MSLERDETERRVYSVSLDRRPDIMVVTVEGEIDIDSASRLEGTLGELIDRGDTDLVVDMAAVSFIDSVGASVLIDAHERAGEAGGSLAVRAPSAPVRRMLSITADSSLPVL